MLLAVLLAGCQFAHKRPVPTAPASTTPAPTTPASAPASPGLSASAPASGPLGAPPGVWDGRIPANDAHWAKFPISSKVIALYPAKAKKQKVPGLVVVNCRIAPSGELKKCRIVSEDPKGYGFGGATLRAITYFRLVAGPYGRTANVDIPIHWR
ncbi:MAG: TonB family protein [Caulobacteraceae bacterium]